MCKAEDDSASGPWDLHVSPIPTAVYSSRAFHSQDVRFDERPHGYDNSTLNAHHRNLDHEEAPYRAHSNSS